MQWRDIVGWEGLYRISDTGIVESYPRNGNGYKTIRMSIFHDKDGYPVFKARNGERVRILKLHRCLAEAYIPNPENKPTVNHKDGNKDNWSLDNLEWATFKEQARHAVDTGLWEIRNKKKVLQLKDGVVVAEYESLSAAGKALGISWTGISAVVRGQRRKAGGYEWRLV